MMHMVYRKLKHVRSVGLGTSGVTAVHRLREPMKGEGIVNYSRYITDYLFTNPCTDYVMFPMNGVLVEAEHGSTPEEVVDRYWREMTG